MLLENQKNIIEIIPVEAIRERDTDLLLLEEIKSNKNFLDWLLNKTIGHKSNYDLIGAWHSLTQVGLGESDLAFIIRIDGKKILFFIENKINAYFQPNQAARYRIRGNQKKEKGECADFYTLLFSPKNYISKNVGFDFYLEYEEVKEWFSKQTNLGNRATYKVDILKIAIEKLRRGYMPIINNEATDFRWAYFDFSNKYYPHLKMNEPKMELPKKTGFIRFKPTDMELNKNEFIIHKQRGDIDLQLKRHNNELDEFKNKYQKKLTDEMKIVQTGKSTSIRISVPKIDIEKDFDIQKENIKKALEKVEALYDWGKTNL